jgi:hypothetical protein
MPITTCPSPDNINPLSPNGFMFHIEKLPSMKYFCQSASIPSISLPTADQNTPMVIVPFKGEQLSYSDLTITFLIDSHLGNYKALNKWMVDGFPTDKLTEPVFHSDGFLHVLGPNNNVVSSIQFTELLPITLEALNFSTTSNDVQYLTGSVTFKYMYYTFVN